MDEKEWLQRLRRRDIKALEEGIRFFSPYVLAVISNILRKSMTREDIEEVAADVFLGNL